MQPLNNTVHKPHFVFISYYFPPMGGGGVQRILKFVKYWNYQSADLSLLTVKKSFFYAADPELENEIPASLSVYRTGSLDPFRLIYKFKQLFPGKSKQNNQTLRESGQWLRKIANHIFLPDSRILWFPFALYKIYRLSKSVKIDLLLATLPPFTTGIIARFAKKILGIPTVLDFRDAWTENPYLPKQNRIYKMLQYRMERKTILSANGLIFVNPQLHQYYREKYTGISQIPQITIRNGFDPDDFIPPPVNEILKSDQISIGIMGTIYSQGNAPLPLLKSIQLLKREFPELYKKLKVKFLGKWTAEFFETVKTMEIDECIEWVGYKPHREALKIAKNFQILCLAIDENAPGSENLTPGRIYEYLALQKPIIAICPQRSDVRNLVTIHDAGICIEYGQTDQLIAQLKIILEDYQTFANQFDYRNIDDLKRSNQTQQLQQFLSQHIF